MATLPPQRPPQLEQLPTFYWTIAHYHDAIERGALHSDHKLELLFGQLVARPPISPLRAATRTALNRLFVRRFARKDAYVSPNGPLTLPYDCEPEPDLVIARTEGHDDHHPYAEDTLLVIEVSDAELIDRDRGVMQLVYARAGIEEYWIVNVYERRLERYTRPQPGQGSYLQREVFKESDRLMSLHLGEFDVADLFV